MATKGVKDGKRLKGGSAHTKFGIVCAERDTLMGAGSYDFPSARSAEEVGEVIPLPSSSGFFGSPLGDKWF